MEIQKSLKENMEFLKVMEFSGIDEKTIEAKMQIEKDSFRVHGILDVEDAGKKQQMAYILFFKKYDNPNTHLPDQFRAILVDQPERQGLFVFDDRHPLHAQDAFHLLQGRAVMKPGDYGMHDWYQMDFKKRDSNGDGSIHLFPLGKTDFDIETALKQHSIKEFLDTDRKADLLAQLYNGRTVTATVQQDNIERLMLLQPNPKDRTVHVRETIATKADLQVSKQTKQEKKQPWEIPIEKKQHKRKGMSL